MDVLKEIFAAYGLLDQIVSDNGPQFIPDNSVLFTKMIGIKHIRSAPYNPALNGLAEICSVTEASTQSKSEGLKNAVLKGTELCTYISTCHNKIYSKFTISIQSDLGYI